MADKTVGQAATRTARRTVPDSRPYLGAEEEGGVPLPERRLCFTHPLARC